MQTVVVTDGKYRASIAAVRTLGEAGYRVVVTQTRAETAATPAVFASRFVSETRWVEGSCKDADYAERLLAVLKDYDRPVLFCIGADTLRVVSSRQTTFDRAADFLIAAPEILDALNDKQEVHERALALHLPVPMEFLGEPNRFPVVIKPHCGEKFGLKAKDRYVIAQDLAEFAEKYQAMCRYDEAPIVQEKVEGDGEGINLLLDKDSHLIAAMCHRRVREYPVSGGPSTCCVSIYDEEKIRQSYALLASFRFVGMAMVEWKGDRILEVNPRVWGSFPMTACCDSPFAAHYARAAKGETVAYTPKDYKIGVKMRFLLNDAAATLGYLRKGHLKTAWGGVVDFFRTPEALYRKDDKAAYRQYLRNSLRKR